MIDQVFRVLLVEDNPGDAFLIQEQFSEAKSYRYHLTHVDYLEKATSSLTKSSFDVILLDLSLPDSKGLETLKIIKEHSLATPIVILSGLNDEELAIQAVRRGAQDYLFKGQVTGELLVHALRYAIERKQIEEQLKTKTSQLESLNQELASFSYMVSHDLRNPLTVVKGMADLLKQTYEVGAKDDKAKIFIDHICKASAKMEQIIQDLLVLSQVKQTELTVSVVNLHDMAQGIIDQLQLKQPSRQVSITVQPNLVAIADENLLNHVIENLLNNAWKYSANQENSKIEIGVINSNPTEVSESLSKLNLEEIDDLNQRNRIRSAYRQLVYFVKDNGIGFDSSITEKLFTPFHRLSNATKFEGTGVGLAIVQSIIHRHQGKVWAEAEENEGATFYFTLGL